MNQMLMGAIAAGSLVAGLFFFRFWRQMRDSLFLVFGIAFALLGLGQAIQALANIPQEEMSYIFLIRLAAFTLILVAILQKNRPAAKRPPS